MVNPYWTKALPLIAISVGAVVAGGLLVSKLVSSTVGPGFRRRDQGPDIPQGSSAAQVQRLTDQYVRQTQLPRGGALGTSPRGALIAREHTDVLQPLGLRVSSLWGQWATVVGIKANSVVLHRLPLLAHIVRLENVTNSTWAYATTDPGIDPELMRQRADLPTRALYALGEWGFGEGQHIGYADFLDSIRPGQTINIYYVHYDEVGAQDAVRSISVLIPASVAQTTPGYTGIIVRPDESIQTPYGGAIVLDDVIGFLVPGRGDIPLDPGDVELLGEGHALFPGTVLIQIGGQAIFSQADITRVEEELGAGAPVLIMRQVPGQPPSYSVFARALQSPPTFQGQHPYIPIRIVEAPGTGGVRVVVRLPSWRSRAGVWAPLPLLPNGAILYAAQKAAEERRPTSTTAFDQVTGPNKVKL